MKYKIELKDKYNEGTIESWLTAKEIIKPSKTNKSIKPSKTNKSIKPSKTNKSTLPNTEPIINKFY